MGISEKSDNDQNKLDNHQVNNRQAEKPTETDVGSIEPDEAVMTEDSGTGAKDETKGEINRVDRDAIPEQTLDDDLEEKKILAGASDLEPHSLQNFYQEYQNCLGYFRDQGGDKDQQQLDKARESFLRWQKYVINLADSFEDLNFEFTQVLEDNNFGIIRDKRILSIPLDLRDQQKNIAEVKNFCKESDTLALASFPEALLSLTGVNIRAASDMDYRLDDTNLSRDLRLFQKSAVNTLLLILKQLSKARPKLLELMVWMNQQEDAIRKTLQTLEAKSILDAIFSPVRTREEKSQEITDILNQADQLLTVNYKIATEAAETARKFKNKYFVFLNTTLIRVVHGLREAHKNYQKQIRTKEFADHEAYEKLVKWEDIYDRLNQLLTGYMEKHLHIFEIPCSRGDNFDHEWHKPYMEAEPDEELDENKIKSVVNSGFVYRDGETKEVVKEVDVIVVRNVK